MVRSDLVVFQSFTVTGDSLTVSRVSSTVYSSMECLQCLLKLGSDVMRLAIVYRRPPRTGEGVTHAMFREHFPLLLDELSAVSGRLVLVGDLIVHMDCPPDPNTRFLKDLLDQTNHEQHVSDVTHSRGHTLDVVITRNGELRMSDIQYDDSVHSDHFSTLFTTDVDLPEPLSQESHLPHDAGH